MLISQEGDKDALKNKLKNAKRPEFINGGSLEDCLSNVYSLLELPGIKWKCFRTKPNAPRGVPLTSDLVLKAYSRCVLVSFYFCFTFFCFYEIWVTDKIKFVDKCVIFLLIAFHSLLLLMLLLLFFSLRYLVFCAVDWCHKKKRLCLLESRLFSYVLLLHLQPSNDWLSEGEIEREVLWVCRC